MESINNIEEFFSRNVLKDMSNSMVNSSRLSSSAKSDTSSVHEDVVFLKEGVSDFTQYDKAVKKIGSKKHTVPERGEGKEFLLKNRKLQTPFRNRKNRHDQNKIYL